MPEPHLEGTSLRRAFQIGQNRIEVLRDVSIRVLKGECVFLCGASGAGKTTLLYTLAGLEVPEAGEVRFEGDSLYKVGENRRTRLRSQRMGFVFQGYFLLPELTALENVTLPLLIAGSTGQDRAESLLDRVGLGKRLHHLPSELSGGEQQRVAIARALVNDPSILFADEPTGNLDSATGDSIMGLLLDLVREHGKTLLVVTHDARLAARGDRRLEILDGRIAG